MKAPLSATDVIADAAAAAPMPGRRALLRGALSLAAGAGLAPPLVFQRAAAAAQAIAPERGKRILVVLELSGGNDGLNTVVPYADDAYHRLRPALAIKPNRVRRIDERFGFNPGLAGFERLYKDGRLAIIHGCGYEQPSFSHFASMAYWHTAAPNSGEVTGWLGRLADAMVPDPLAAGANPAPIVNIDTVQSLAVASRRHVPVVFDDPALFERKAFQVQRPLIDGVAVRVEDRAGNRVADRVVSAGSVPPSPPPDAGANRRWLHEIAKSARQSSAAVREACAGYRTPVDYGIVPVDLPKVAALIAAGLPARLFYVAYRNNAFDTHVHQAELHQRLLTYVADAVSGFLRDMERIGRADDVVLLAFSEFGRRVPENANLGTDHGTAGPVFIAGKRVKGGHHGQPVDLANLLPDQNLRHTCDFRRAYASVIEGWLGVESAPLLRGRFEPFALFG